MTQLASANLALRIPMIWERKGFVFHSLFRKIQKGSEIREEEKSKNGKEVPTGFSNFHFSQIVWNEVFEPQES